MKKFFASPGGRAFTGAIVSAVIAFISLFWPVSNAYGTDCGTWLYQSNSAAQYEDSMSSIGTYRESTRQVDSCEEAMNQQRPTILLFAGLAIALTAAGLIRRYSASMETKSSRAP